MTFQVATIYIKRPEFLFTLKGFSTPETADVVTSLAETWEDPATTATIRMLADSAPNPEEKQEWHGQMVNFLGSATVHRLDIRSQGGRENPHFNVYANGDIIDDDETWLQLRKYLRNRSYKSMVIGTGRVLQEDFVCSLCHGHDHPRGLCPFPQIPGWNGGGHLPKRQQRISASPSDYPRPQQRSNNNAPWGRGLGNYRGRGPSHLQGRF